MKSIYNNNDLEIGNENSTKLQLHLYAKRIILDNVSATSLNDDCHEIVMTNFILITSICLIGHGDFSFHICIIL